MSIIKTKMPLPVDEMIHPNSPQYMEIYQMFVDYVAKFGANDTLTVFEAIIVPSHLVIVETMIDIADEGLKLGVNKARTLTPTCIARFEQLLSEIKSE